MHMRCQQLVVLQVSAYDDTEGGTPRDMLHSHMVYLVA
jgi:hypothetical protein